MRILVSGASGLVGTALCKTLAGEGHQVLHLERPGSAKWRPANGPVRWDPEHGTFEAAAAEGIEGVVHLAGASIAAGRWNEARKRLLRSSRVEATHHLVNELGKLSPPPRVFISASAVGYYGNRGDEVLTEESTPTNDFLGQLSQDWEREASGAGRFGARVVVLRFGVILAAQGGALGKMLPPFRLGLGGPIGSGRQWMSWISLPDVVALIRHVLTDAALRGALNAVAPNPVTNAQFAKTLGRVLRRPVFAPFPAFAARLLFGEMADALLLASQRVVPQRLQQASFRFQHADLEQALRAVLAR